LTLALSQEQFEFLKSYKAKNPTHSWSRIHPKFYVKFPDAIHVDETELPKLFHKAEEDLAFINPAANELFETYQKSGIDYSLLVSAPNAFLYRYRLPGFSELHGPFSRQEEELFISIISGLHEMPQWGLFSLAFPGRAGYQLYNFYKRLLNEHKIEPLEPPKKTKLFFDHQALSNQQEDALCRYIMTRFEAHLRTTIKMICQQAIQIFF